MPTSSSTPAATPTGWPRPSRRAGVEGTVVEASWYGDRPVPLPLGEAFHARRLTVRSSQVGRLPAARTPRWDHARRLALAMRLLADARLDVLISGEDGFEDLPAVMARLSRSPGNTLLPSHPLLTPSVPTRDSNRHELANCSRTRPFLAASRVWRKTR